MAVYVFLAVALVTVVLFVVAGSLEHFDRAWNILIGLRTPFGTPEPIVGFFLSAFGYLLVPTSVGLIVADWISRVIRKNLQPVEVASEKIGRGIAKRAADSAEAAEAAAKAAIAAAETAVEAAAEAREGHA
jgi:hypothetical protein